MFGEYQWIFEGRDQWVAVPQIVLQKCKSGLDENFIN